jgi:hypothetical protein
VPSNFRLFVRSYSELSRTVSAIRNTRPCIGKVSHDAFRPPVLLIDNDSGDETFVSPAKEAIAPDRSLSQVRPPLEIRKPLSLASSLAFIQKACPFRKIPRQRSEAHTRLTGLLARWQDDYVIAVAIVSCVSRKGEARLFMKALPARVIDKLVRPVAP